MSMNQWFILRLIASILFCAASVYMVFEMAMKRPMLVPVLLFAVALVVYVWICRTVRKKAEEESKKNR